MKNDKPAFGGFLLALALSAVAIVAGSAVVARSERADERVRARRGERRRPLP